MKHIKRIIPLAFVGFFLVLLVRLSGWTDSLVQITSQGAQSANDSVYWSQLGGDATALLPSFSATSAGAVSVTGNLSGPNSLTSVVCPASPSCSWAAVGFACRDTLVWTADVGNSGNGPLTLNFGSPISGAGALIQADGPSQFTAEITAFNGGSPLGSFTQTSDSNGDATYLGVQDNSGANITSVEFQLTSCQGDCTDFAIGTLSLNDSGDATPTPSPTPAPCTSASPTPTAVGTPSATPTPTPTPIATPSLASLALAPSSVKIHATFDSENGAKPKTRKVKLTNKKKTASGASINISAATVGTSLFSASTNCNGISLAPGQNCKVTVTFTPPSSAGTFPDSLTVTSNAANGSTLSVPLTGIGRSVQ
ncbi:MAG: hypothetical protein ACREQT_03815 [Candidatus Binataceae bacterium]